MSTSKYFSLLPRFVSNAAISIHSGKKVPLILIPVVVFLMLGLQLHLQWGWPSSVGRLIKRPPAAGIVVASLRSEDTAWVHRHLQNWSRTVYVVDDPSAKFTVPKNKGREAMVYLSYIIDNYNSLTRTTIFVHASRFAWQNDDPDYDVLPTLRNLNLTYVQASGYVNLRCIWALGCPVEIAPHVDAPANADHSSNATDGRELTTKEIFKQAFEELMPGVEVPHKVGVTCCSQFAVSREAIHARSKEDYIRWRDWLIQTPLADDLSGRVFEYMWHIIFGKEAVFCPSAAECYCNLYGFCNLKCQENECDGRYVLPQFATLPAGWPRVGWSGEVRNFTGPS
ncbi:hypothetical protein C7999DRAFT_17547 [Corynascus novoguineensis]|uniref:Uncharacterized protein n=1 Tax=Corynascus novoguineensis TaxID=1126955 RepID=A0AAN7CL77_9PEZI|nr:hypothetical protein C7999DRAFT_17547 [Corynascus novoguineensis]